ncbi:MAG TPA: MarR family transcriptional regulator [Deltaproteobacteria bacterium]|nr:MarR family transcriptional regulator [Deltaproteobacteria bacterium]
MREAGARRQARAPGTAAEELLLELAYTFFRLRAEADRRARRVGQSTGRLGILRTLAEEGPRTVAQIARSRPVARQGVQRLADALADEGLLESIDNPDHRRSKLLRLTSRGRKAYQALLRGQQSFAQELARGFSEDELRRCAWVLRKLRERLRAAPEAEARREPSA